MLELLTLFAIVFGVNLLPAFGPPTWAILVLYVLNSELHPALLIPVAALAAASGRLLLALAFRLLGNRLPEKYRKQPRRPPAARWRRTAATPSSPSACSRSRPSRPRNCSRRRGWPASACSPSPSPSSSAGPSPIRSTSSPPRACKATSLGDTFREALTSPWGIALQVAMLIGLVLLAQDRLGEMAEPREGLLSPIPWSHPATRHYRDRARPVPCRGGRRRPYARAGRRSCRASAAPRRC